MSRTQIRLGWTFLSFTDLPTTSSCKKRAYFFAYFKLFSDRHFRNLRDTNNGGGRMKITESSQSRPFPFVNASDGTPKMVFGDNRGDVHPGTKLKIS